MFFFNILKVLKLPKHQNYFEIYSSDFLIFLQSVFHFFLEVKNLNYPKNFNYLFSISISKQSTNKYCILIFCFCNHQRVWFFHNLTQNNCFYYLLQYLIILFNSLSFFVIFAQIIFGYNSQKFIRNEVAKYINNWMFKWNRT